MDNNKGTLIFGGAIALFYAYNYLRSTFCKPKISEIWIYPVKSCAGYKVNKAKVLDTGFENDRMFAIVDSSTGRVVTQRVESRMALISAVVKENHLYLQYRENDNLKNFVLPMNKEGPKTTGAVWGFPVDCFDMGDQVAQWIGSILGSELKFRLVRMDDQFVRPTDPVNDPRGQNTIKSVDVITPFGKASMADDRPFLLTSSSSLRALEKRITTANCPDIVDGDKRVLMSRFRPNIIVDDAEAYDEDYWKTIRIVGDETGLTGLKLASFPCSRCKLPENSPITGSYNALNKEPMSTLKEMHKGNHIGYTDGKPMKEVYFGVRLDHGASQGSSTFISVGDVVEVVEKV